jgi:hypothetical protein|nr:hypothetical protein [Candidatus Krumholzibacteria bacterium]
MKPVICMLMLCLWVAPAAASPEKEECPTPPLNPLQVSQEIQSILDSAQARIDELLANAAPTARQNLDFLQEISRIKRESRVQVLQVQLRVAREKQQTENVAQLEDMIDRLTSPRDHRAGPGQPFNKPAHR